MISKVHQQEQRHHAEDPRSPHQKLTMISPQMNKKIAEEVPMEMASPKYEASCKLDSWRR